MLQLSYAEVDFGGQDLVSLLSWASDSDELDGLRVGSGWAQDGLRMFQKVSCHSVMSQIRQRLSLVFPLQNWERERRGRPVR